MSDKDNKKLQNEIYEATIRSAVKFFENSSAVVAVKRKKCSQLVYSQYLESIGEEQPNYMKIDNGGNAYAPNHFRKFYKMTLPSEIRWIVGVGQFGVILCEGLASLEDIESGDAFKRISANLGALGKEQYKGIRWYSYEVDFEAEEYAKELNIARQSYVNFIAAHPEIVCLTIEEYGHADKFKLLPNQEFDSEDDSKYLAPSSITKLDYEPMEMDGKIIRNHYYEERDAGRWYSISFASLGAVFVYETNKADVLNDSSNPAIEMIAIRRADYLTKGTDLEKVSWTYNFISLETEDKMWEYVKRIDDEHYIEVAFHVSPDESDRAFRKRHI